MAASGAHLPAYPPFVGDDDAEQNDAPDHFLVPLIDLHEAQNVGENGQDQHAADSPRQAARPPCQRCPPDEGAGDGIQLQPGAEHRILVGDIDPGWQAVDIGPMAAKEYTAKILDAKTIVWNGPMGVFEIPPFDKGTKAVAQAVAKATQKGAKSIVGGGDSASAIAQLGLQNKISHISTGGGASLEFLEGKAFKAIDILDDK